MPARRTPSLRKAPEAAARISRRLPSVRSRFERPFKILTPGSDFAHRQAGGNGNSNRGSKWLAQAVPAGAGVEEDELQVAEADALALAHRAGCALGLQLQLADEGAVARAGVGQLQL